MTIIAVVICLLYLLNNVLLGAGSIIRYVFDGRWERGINCFSFTACLTIICAAYVVVHALRKVLRYLSGVLGARGETVCHLVSNFAGYLAVFISAYYCLAFCGMDTKTLVASAGIMSVVIGLGANKLIADILAGLAIIFEGDFRVGDVVEIHDIRGEVKDIGIRTTKYKDKEGKLHIINNSELGTIVNNSTSGAMAVINIWVNRSISLEKIEKLLAQHSSALMAQNPNMLGASKLFGIDDLSGANANLRIDTPCVGKERSATKRYLLRKWKTIFEENGIYRVPEPNMILSSVPEEFFGAMYGKTDIFSPDVSADREASEKES